MGGLIKKDLFSLRNNSTRKLIAIAIFVVFALFYKEVNTLIFCMSFLSVILLMSALGIDERVKWNNFEKIMPVTSFDIVASKYVFNLIMIVASSAFSFLVYFIITGDYYKNLLYCIGAISVELIVVAIFIPIILKFGIDASKIIMIIICLVPAIFSAILKYLGINLDNASLPMSDSYIITGVSFSPFIALVVSLISIKISEIIYKNKELV